MFPHNLMSQSESPSYRKNHRATRLALSLETNVKRGGLKLPSPKIDRPNYGVQVDPPGEQIEFPVITSCGRDHSRSGFDRVLFTAFYWPRWSSGTETALAVNIWRAS